MPDEAGIEETRESRIAQTVAAGSIAEGVVGAAAATVAVVALTGVWPRLLLSVATIGAGASLMLQGGAIAGRFSALINEASASRITASEVGGGMTAEFIGGVAGIVLGILSLLNIYPLVLLPAAVIVLGGTLILGSSITARMNMLLVERVESRRFAREVARQAIAAAAGVQVLIGLGAVTLGVLGLTGVSPVLLSLIAVLAVGISDVLSGTSIAGRLVNTFRR
ncbi:MAG TPA: hypothetical protein PK314_11135 [Deltaproteobacteria bacterium]|nr:hypothetical protein [Deltaproteobacteria bacterium]